MNKHASNFIILLASLAWVSCSHKASKRPITDESQLVAEEGLISVSGTQILKELPHFTTFNMVMTDDYLVLCNGIPNPYYYDLYSVEQGKVVGSVGREGGGPGEFVGVLTTNTKSSNTLIIRSFDMRNEIYHLHLDSALNYPDYESKVAVKFDERSVHKVGWIGDGGYVLSNTSWVDSTRLCVIDKSGKTLRKTLGYPFPEKLGATRPEIYGLIYQSALVTNPKNQRAGLFNYSGPNWDIVSFENPSEPEIVNQVHLRSIDFRDASVIGEKSKSYSAAIVQSNKKGFVSVTLNEEFIYALYSGKSWERYGEDSMNGQIVLKLNWQGEIVKRFMLDKPTRTICVDKTGKKLYSIVSNPDYDSLYEYSID